MKPILIEDDDVNTSLNYKKWLKEEEGFNLTLINELRLGEICFKPQT